MRYLRFANFFGTDRMTTDFRIGFLLDTRFLTEFA